MSIGGAAALIFFHAELHYLCNRGRPLLVVGSAQRPASSEAACGNGVSPPYTLYSDRLWSGPLLPRNANRVLSAVSLCSGRTDFLVKLRIQLRHYEMDLLNSVSNYSWRVINICAGCIAPELSCCGLDVRHLANTVRWAASGMLPRLLRQRDTANFKPLRLDWNDSNLTRLF